MYSNRQHSAHAFVIHNNRQHSSEGHLSGRSPDSHTPFPHTAVAVDDDTPVRANRVDEEAPVASSFVSFDTGTLLGPPNGSSDTVTVDALPEAQEARTRRRAPTGCKSMPSTVTPAVGRPSLVLRTRNA